MTFWKNIKSDILKGCEDILRPHAYKLVRSRSSFEKPTATGRLIVLMNFVSSDVGNRFVRIRCGVRNNEIERIVSRTLSTDKGYHPSTITIGTDCDTVWLLNTQEEQASTIKGLQSYIQDVALPFLEKDYSLQDFSALLNVTDAEGRPVYRVGMGIRFWQRGLAAAKLAGDERFDDLKRHYTDHVRVLSNGFYFPEFEKCLRYIDEYA
ncbi:MAG: hypothetical protein JWQ71_1736 [Pedosphaera sp.]|nr:hypothetical protein [Pedosphaera sp.]